MNHGFCVSIYIRDPSGNMVEFCHTTRPFTAEERASAHAMLTDADPELHNEAEATIHQPVVAAASNYTPVRTDRVPAQCRATRPALTICPGSRPKISYRSAIVPD